MRLLKYISFRTIIILAMGVLSCGNRNEKKVPARNQDSIKINQIKYKDYLQKEEIGTILENWEKFTSDSEYRQHFNDQALIRQQKIRGLSYTMDGNRKIPYPFKSYFLPEELVEFKSDSLPQLIFYYKIMEKRQMKISKLIKNSIFLRQEEIQQFIRDSMTNSTYYNQLTLQRKESDSITYWSDYNERMESSKQRSTIIDTELPFGSSILLNYSFPKKGFSFSNNSKDSELGHQQKFYDLITYYKNIDTPHPDLEDVILPGIEIKEVEYIRLQSDDFNSEPDLLKLNNINGFTQRLENIGSYEVFFNLRETDFQECDVELNRMGVANCCYGFRKCKEEGFLVFYNRKKKSAIALNPYFINPDDEGTSFRLFHIAHNTIKIYQAYSNVDYSRGNAKINNYINQTHQIIIETDGDFKVNEIDYKQVDDNEEE